MLRGSRCEMGSLFSTAYMCFLSIAGSFSNYDILDCCGYGCAHVDLVNIRGTSCTNCTVYITTDTDRLIHVDSFRTGKYNCDLPSVDALTCNTAGEDNFGFYICANPAFRCSSSPASTTQWWIGVW